MTFQAIGKYLIIHTHENNIFIPLSWCELAARTPHWLHTTTIRGLSMKTIFLSFLFMLALLNVKGQTASTLSGKLYITDPDLKKFAGQWSYSSHDTVFTIDLKYAQQYIAHPSDKYYIDVIEGDYTLKKGGRVILTSIGGAKKLEVGRFLDKEANNNKMRILFYDIVIKKGGDVAFELLDNGKTASWKLQMPEGVYFGEIDYTFSVPRKALMKRVK
jgi:hypothetical protein